MASLFPHYSIPKAYASTSAAPPSKPAEVPTTRPRRASLITAEGPEDWRDWTLACQDDLNDEIFALPFHPARQAALRGRHAGLATAAPTPDRDRDPLHRLVGLARNPYRPELHYMRGPGPKWHAKHPALNP